MRFFIALALLMTAVTAIPAEEPTQAEINVWVTSCRDSMGKLGKALKAELQAAMRDDGPVGALQVCNVEAVPITETISAEEGVLVGRTSLKPRNPANAPDEWEAATLEQFELRKEKGEKAGDLEAWTIVTDEGGHRTFRYMKAIGTMPMCLKCHGRRLSDDVQAKIDGLYPDDQAVGFKAGDLRGAFTLQLPID